MIQPPPNQLKTLELRHGDQLIGTLVVSELDFPWVICDFQPTAAFADCKPLFDKELQMIEETEDWEAWEEVYHKIEALNLQLVDPESQAIIHEFLLHIEEDQAWFRY